jgi:ketosteroid isomerase-like protein
MQHELLDDMRRSAAAWNAGDIGGHVAMYSDSATMMVKAGPRGGREVIRGMLERSFWKDGKPFQQLAFSDLVVTPLGRDYAMMTGAFALSGGDKPPASGRFTLIWQRTASGWRIIHDHSS